MSRRCRWACTFLLASAGFTACGGSGPPLASPPPRSSEPVEPMATETYEPSADSHVQVDAVTSRILLEGRFEISLPSGIALTQSDAWGFSAEKRGQYDSYDFEVQGCTMSLAVRSHGLLRPEALVVRDAEAHFFAPSEVASPRLEILTTPSRTFDVLEVFTAALGAVVFEPDGTATDFFLWPHLAEGEEEVEPEGEDWDTQDWVDAQRQDPRLLPCFEIGRALLDEALRTLVARRPFQSETGVLMFGYDENADASIVYRAALPPGWVITAESAYDAWFDDLHRRQPWTWADSAPSARARVWRYSGVSPDDEPRPRLGPRRAHLFDHDLRFEARAGDFGVCALAENRDLGLTDSVCLQGTRAEQAELLTLLGTFARAPIAAPSEEPTGDAAHRLPSPCVTQIEDSDGQTNVRALGSSASAVVAAISNGTVIVPVEQRGRWLRITAPHAGWVYAGNVRRHCM